MVLHFAMNDHRPRERNEAQYQRFGRWLLAVAVLAAGRGACWGVPHLVVLLLVALLTVGYP